MLLLGMLAVALYAQHRIAVHTASPRNTMLTRTVLAVVGVALGSIAVLRPGRAHPFLKHARGEKPS